MAAEKCVKVQIFAYTSGPKSKGDMRVKKLRDLAQALFATGGVDTFCINTQELYAACICSKEENPACPYHGLGNA